jgi:serine acetyltransferase
MIRLPRSFNSITARYQRRKVHEKCIEKHVNLVKRSCRWLYRAARWNQKRGNYATAMLLMGLMTDFVGEA